MKLKTEIISEKQKALIVCEHYFEFIDLLKKKLKTNSVDPFFSSIRPKNIKTFDYSFFIVHKKNGFQIQIHHHHRIKTVEITNNNLTDEDIDKILWFTFSADQEKFLKLNYLTKKDRPFYIKKPNFIKHHITQNNFITALILLFFGAHLIFIPFGLISTFFIYRSFTYAKQENFEKVKKNISKASVFNKISKKLYDFSKPTFRIFGISGLPDNFIDINNYGIRAVEKGQTILINSKEIQKLIFIKNKSTQEKDDMKLRFQKLNSSLKDLTEDIVIINEKLDLPFEKIKSFKKNLSQTSDLLTKARKLIVYFEKIISNKTTVKYLIFFANNMELRPGGGFIGSFAVIEIKDYQIGELKVYDVYDADGQLTAHLDPPKPLAKYLNLPHWFLRDSNFSPDFLENYQKALFFLEKEMGMTGFDGSILLTTTSVENILTAFNDIYLPDYKETINAKNFYLKTQFYVEKNFFPGSIQKQKFLSSVAQQIIINFENVSAFKLLLALKKSLDEKQIAVYINDETIQPLFDSSFWSGHVIEPKCLMGANNCIIDYIFPYDANVGANKANFFVNRSIYLKTIFDSNEKINHQLLIKYENTSPSEIFPTGYYRNYFQILIPKNSLVKLITVNGVMVEDYDQKDDIFKLIGFFFEIPPKKNAEIKINYQLKDSIKKGNQIYQLIFQKQLGANNSDLILDYRFNKDISLINQNFSPLVKDDSIIYNTNLSTDKLFFIELSNL